MDFVVRDFATPQTMFVFFSSRSMSTATHVTLKTVSHDQTDGIGTLFQTKMAKSIPYSRLGMLESDTLWAAHTYMCYIGEYPPPPPPPPPSHPWFPHLGRELLYCWRISITNGVVVEQLKAGRSSNFLPRNSNDGLISSLQNQQHNFRLVAEQPKFFALLFGFGLVVPWTELDAEYVRNDQGGKILHCQHIQQGLADEVNLFEEIYEYGRYSHCDMAPDRDPPPVTNFAPVSPLGWDASVFINIGSRRSQSAILLLYRYILL